MLIHFTTLFLLKNCSFEPVIIFKNDWRNSTVISILKLDFQINQTEHKLTYYIHICIYSWHIVSYKSYNSLFSVFEVTLKLWFTKHYHNRLSQLITHIDRWIKKLNLVKGNITQRKFVAQPLGIGSGSQQQNWPICLFVFIGRTELESPLSHSREEGVLFIRLFRGTVRVFALLACSNRLLS